MGFFKLPCAFFKILGMVTSSSKSREWQSHPSEGATISSPNEENGPSSAKKMGWLPPLPSEGDGHTLLQLKRTATSTKYRGWPSHPNQAGSPQEGLPSSSSRTKSTSHAAGAHSTAAAELTAHAAADCDAHGSSTRLQDAPDHGMSDASDHHANAPDDAQQ